MGSLAVIAKQLGHRVSGSDKNVYPPMSTQLEELGIELREGYHPEHLQPKPDLVIIGNALSRGNPAVETVLRERLAVHLRTSVAGASGASEQVGPGGCGYSR